MKVASFGLGPRLTLAISFLILSTCSLLSVIIVQQNIEEVRKNLMQRSEELAERLSRDAELGLLSGDRDSLQELVRGATLRRDTAYAAVLDNDGKLWAAEGARPQSWRALVGTRLEASDAPIFVEPDLWELRLPIVTTTAAPQREELEFEPAAGNTVEREIIGMIVLGVSGEGVSDLRAQMLVVAGLTTLLVVLLGMSFVAAIARRMTQPLRALARAADEIAQGNLDARVETTGQGEIRLLARSFETMVESLRRNRAQLHDYSRNLEEMVRSRTERLEIVNRDLEQANRLKSEFLATVSHELRTPLHVIIGYAAMLQEGSGGDVTGSQRDLLETIERYSKVQLDLLTDVLDFSRLASGRISFHVEHFDLGDVLREVEGLFRLRLDGRPVTLTLDLPDQRLPLETDRIKLQEILRNLVDNAIKFTARGEISMRARFAGDDRVTVEVSDTGPGIDAAELANIFEPFHQAGPSSTRPTGGVGLGLSIVKQLCGALGGECTIDSVVGAGSTFRVTLPRRLVVS